MLSYNGFSSNERAKVGRIQLAAIRSGALPNLTSCELCLQNTGQIQLHNEDYSKPFDDAHPICRSCHGALHARFNNPERWAKRLKVMQDLRNESDDKFAKHWWSKLLIVPIDINPNN